MSFKDQVQQLLISQIKNLPPIMLEEIIGQTKEQIYTETRQEVIREINHYMQYIITDYVDEYIDSLRKPTRNPPRFNHISQDIQSITCNLAETIVDKYRDNFDQDVNSLSQMALIYEQFSNNNDDGYDSY